MDTKSSAVIRDGIHPYARRYSFDDPEAIVVAVSEDGAEQGCMGVAIGDYDNDGDQDIFAQMGGFFPADAFHNALCQA